MHHQHCAPVWLVRFQHKRTVTLDHPGIMPAVQVRPTSAYLFPGSCQVGLYGIGSEVITVITAGWLVTLAQFVRNRRAVYKIP
jgi:hypothetical protein